jgi:hypothetical protein
MLKKIALEEKYEEYEVPIGRAFGGLRYGVVYDGLREERSPWRR